MGEVAAEVLTDFPERFAERRRLFVVDQSGSRRELHLENFWPHKERLVLKFAGVDSISDAESLLGNEVQIPREECAELEEGAAYTSDLIGCHVFARQQSTPEYEIRNTPLREVGVVADVTFGAGEAPILEICGGNKEYLVPLAQEYILSLDTAAKRLELALPEGMLELDAPLSKEEKDLQKNSNS